MSPVRSVKVGEDVGGGGIWTHPVPLAAGCPMCGRAVRQRNRAGTANRQPADIKALLSDRGGPENQQAAANTLARNQVPVVGPLVGAIRPLVRRAADGWYRLLASCALRHRSQDAP
ncbi:MAG: hypothetical protein K2X87_04120 [Gemmataceae bacterium]|nr:hypothetical protein [Gemmataceae bacterium]